jgi:hypothetical protein
VERVGDGLARGERQRRAQLTPDLGDEQVAGRQAALVPVGDALQGGHVVRAGKSYGDRIHGVFIASTAH